MKKKWLSFVNKLKKIPEFFAHVFYCFKNSNYKVKFSILFMGLGQILYHQIIKGLCYLMIEIGFIVFMVLQGGKWFVGFFTLGTEEANVWLGTPGDNSVIMLLLGIFAWIIIILFIVFYVSNLIDVYHTYRLDQSDKHIPSFKEEIKEYVDKKFYKVSLFFPIVGVCIFSILPIVFMILIAFTNYGGTIVPPKLVDWTGFESFQKIFSVSTIAPTFFRILGWNFAWAFLSTFINYFLGILLALLLNKKCVKGKAIWRMFPLLAYAVPGFITLIAFKFMFSNKGPINNIINDCGGKTILFLGIDSTWISRGIGLFVNAWLTVPTIMLLVTGLLSNLNNDLYEAAQMDGASRRKQFFDITLPFLIFSTTPTLISQFVGNFNNFGIFFFLRGTITSDGYFLASDTDLLINWLYRLSIDNKYYSIGAAISLVIFVITSAISLTIYVRSPAYRKENTFR